MRPLVSVLLPVYQTERYVAEAIEGVLSQSLQDWELVVSDNASSDRTVEVVERYRDPRIRVFRQTENLGMVDNWLFVMRQARGELGCVLCADDAFEPRHLERKAGLLSGQTGALFAHGPSRTVDGNGNLTGLFEPGFARSVTSREFLERNFRENRVVESGAVFRADRMRELGLGFDPRYQLLMDWHLWMLLALHSEIVLCDNEPTVRFRLHPGSGTEQSRKSWRWDYEFHLLRSDLLIEHEPRWRKLGFDVERMQRELLKVLWPFALQRLRMGRWAEFRQTWDLYHRVYSPLDAVLQLPEYLVRRVARLVARPRTVAAKGSA